MPYTINKYSGEPLVVLDDGTIDTSTSISLVGRNYVGYGEIQNENFVFLMENFANENPPARPLPGQLWYNSQNKLLHVFDSDAWRIVGSAILSEEAPENPPVGALWMEMPESILYVWNGSAWIFIGPETAPGFGTTKAKSTVILDSNGSRRPVILLTVNDVVIAICTSAPFIIGNQNPIPGFGILDAGINLSNLTYVKGTLKGTSDDAEKLKTARNINGIPFDGTQDISIRSSTTNKLIAGTFLTGGEFDGSAQTTLSVDATSANIVGKVVSRNSEGGFAAGTITADLVGTVTGNVNAASGTSNFDIVRANQFIGATLSGNAFSATRLQTERKINGVDFNGTQDITVTASAQTLSGSFINPGVTISSLTRVGTLESLITLDLGITVGTAGQLKLSVESGVSTVRAPGGRLNFGLSNTGSAFSLISGSTSVTLGGPNKDTILGAGKNIGLPSNKFSTVYADSFVGNADTATLASSTNNIVGGSTGSLVYQSASGVTTFLPVGANGQILKSKTGNIISWENPDLSEKLTKGSYLIFTNTTTNDTVLEYSNQVPVTISVDATSSNVANKVVLRDNSGDIYATTFRGIFEGTSTTQALTDVSNKIATTAFVRGLVDQAPFWAGVTTFANVVATYASFPVGTKVAYWEERIYYRPANSNGGSVQIDDRYRRVIRKNSSTSWGDVGG